MYKIIPDTDKEYENLKPKRIPFTYLHGKLQEDCGYDCYGFVDCDLKTRDDSSTYIDDSFLEDGEYPCTYKGKVNKLI